MDSPEKNVAEFYERNWQNFVKWINADETLGIHVAYYEKGIKTYEEAILNMNDFIGRLLKLEDKKPMNILDAGCGVGGTLIYLAKKFPNILFEGITITPSQVELAKRFAKERKAINTNFRLGNYNKTIFPDNHFDGAFVLESVNYTKNIKEFADEMSRILKPGGRLVVVDGFRTDVALNVFTKKIYDLWRIARENVDLHNLTNFKSSLKKAGFLGVENKDLSRNVGRSLIQPFIIGVPFLCSCACKRIIKRRSYDPSKDIHYFVGTSVLSCFLGFGRIIEYHAITAVKK